jgi:hypothetical protein
MRLPTAAEEIQLTLEPATNGSPLEQSFIDNQGAAILLRTDPQLPPGTARIGDKEITGLDRDPSRFHVEAYSSTPQHPDGTMRSWIDRPIDLDMFLDHSVAEIFINHRHAITHRYYKRTTTEPAIAITLGGLWRITEQEAWSLNSIW